MRRLLSRGVGAVAGRARQRASAFLEFARPVHAGEVTGLAGPVLARLRQGGVAFFAGALSDEAPGFVADHAADWRERTLESAQRLLAGKFDLLGYRGLDFGRPVQWHLDPVSGRRAPFRHWSRIDPLDPAEVGDAKVIWELGRHQWLVRLAQGFLLTGDERYSHAALDSIDSWLEENPPGIGIHWASSLEIALRLISWCWTLVLLRHASSLNEERIGRILASVEEQGRRVERQLSTWYSPNTHLTGEALGLFYAGVVFHELPSAARWIALGREILLEEREHQVLPDGVHVERATCYQRYTADIYLHFLALAARAGVSVPPDVAEAAARLCDFLVAIRRPDGSLPSIGDADGGWLMPLAPRAADDVRGTLSTGAVLLGRGDYAEPAGALTPETMWLFGAASALRAPEAHASASRLFPDGGFAIMRGGDHQLVFDVGP
ncbi:MAG TPA: heparinase II/III family protein, partial [bacterium]|nr:heparinase II/III family protein [bacterium]